MRESDEPKREGGEAGRPAGAPWPVDRAAEYLGISPRHLARLTAAGRVRVVRLGRRVLVPHSEVVRLAEQGDQ